MAASRRGMRWISVTAFSRARRDHRADVKAPRPLPPRRCRQLKRVAEGEAHRTVCCGGLDDDSDRDRVVTAQLLDGYRCVAAAALANDCCGPALARKIARRLW